MTTPKGGDTRTTTQQTTLPSWLTGAQENLVATGQNLTSPFTQSPPTQPIAPINSDQWYAIDRVRDEAVANQNSRALPVAGTNVNAQSVGNISSGDVQALMPGYIQSVIDPAVAGIRREGANRDAAIGARYAAGSSFGGSGEALARGQNARATGESIASTTAALMAQGYSQAQALALANQQAQTGNASRALDASRANATNSLQADTLRNQFENDDQARDLRILNALMQTGQQQQTYAQRESDLPYTMLDRLRGVVSGVGQTESTRTDTAPNTAPSPLQSLLGLGTAILGTSLGGPMVGTTVAGSLLGNILGNGNNGSR